MSDPRVIDMTGLRFGRLTVVGMGTSTQKRGASWACRCDCGATANVHRNELIKGSTLSCGCYRAETASAWATRHGMSGTTTYKSWLAMRNRCSQAATGTNALYYRDRGISCCERWASFDAFLADMGERPAGTTLDRVNGAGNYEPGNCRWATRRAQANNRRGNVALTIGARTMTVSEWALAVGINAETLRCRIDRHGWSAERAVSTPARFKKRST